VRENAGKLPMAVATGGSQPHIDEVLKHIGLRQYFQTVVTSLDVQRQKPAPDIFLEAARRLGVAPQFCRGYEDTDLGLQAIRAAGMEAIDIRPMTRSTIPS
jgi:beta-phosphoglucomutase-like phosphatase (HAD superfamily)